MDFFEENLAGLWNVKDKLQDEIWLAFSDLGISHLKVSGGGDSAGAGHADPPQRRNLRVVRG